MKNKKKQPGDFQKARAKHVGRQRTYDQLKDVREGRSDRLRLHGKEYRVEAADSPEDYWRVVYVHHGRICIGQAVCDESAVWSDFGKIYRPQVVARIIEEIT